VTWLERGAANGRRPAPARAWPATTSGCAISSEQNRSYVRSGQRYRAGICGRCDAPFARRVASGYDLRAPSRTALGSASRSTPASRVTRWEYFVLRKQVHNSGEDGLRSTSELATALQALGAEGWDAVSCTATPEGGGTSSHLTILMKRPLQDCR
jgi:hypothetical protein